MKKGNRFLAILLAFTMVLTFMPMLAFAEDEEIGEEPQTTELTAEEVEAEPQATELTAEEADAEPAETEAAEEAAEEVPAKEAVEAAASEEPEVIGLKFIPVPEFEIVADEGGDWPSYDAVGNKFIFTYSNGKTEQYICKTYLINNAEGYIDYKYFEEKTNEVMSDVYPVVNGEEGGVFRYGVNNTVAFRTGNAYTEEFPVKVDPAPAALEFIPAAGVTLWAYEEAYNIDDSAFFAIGNTFNVTYTDGSKKTFVCEEEPLRKKGETEYYLGYFEENKSHIDANGVFLDMDFYYDHDIPDGGFVIGDNPVRFHVYGADGDVFTESYYNVIGKPDACTTHKLHTVKAIKATCQAPGIKAHYECSICHKIFSDKKGKKETTYAKLATKKAKHVFKKKIVTDEYLKSPATCTKKATYYYACKTCGEKGKKTFTSGKALGHKFEQAVTKATPTKNGSIGQKCTVCGKKGKNKVIYKASKIAVVKKYKKKGVPASVIAAGGAFIEVKNAKGKKIAASEYDITFSNNEEAGTGTATITFKGANYEGSKVVSYKIVK